MLDVKEGCGGGAGGGGGTFPLKNMTLKLALNPLKSDYSDDH